MNKKPTTVTTSTSAGDIIYQVGQTMANSVYKPYFSGMLERIDVVQEKPGLIEFILHLTEIENGNKWRLRITHSGPYTIFGGYDLISKPE